MSICPFRTGLFLFDGPALGGCDLVKVSVSFSQHLAQIGSRGRKNLVALMLVLGGARVVGRLALRCASLAGLAGPFF
jgi:hypothetical protein